MSREFYREFGRKSSNFTVVNDCYFQNDFLINSIEIKSEKSLSLISSRNEEKVHLQDDNFKASIFIFCSYFLYSIVNLLGKYIGYYYPEVENSTTNLIRGLILVLFSHITWYYQKFDYLSELKKPKIKLLLLFIRCFFGSLCNFLLFESFKHMRISSSFTIFNISPIFVSILSVIFLNGKFTYFDFFSFFICFFSVCLITKPSFLIGVDDDGDTPLGIMISVISAILSAIAMFSNRVISKDFHYSISIYGMGIFFFFQSAFILPFTEKGFSSYNFTCFCISLVLSSIFFFSLGLFIHGLNIGDPIKVLPITYIAIVLNQFYNSLIFKQYSDFFDYLGSFLIIMINVLRTVMQK